ncbi:MAG: class I SAM-dependent methyltransferase [Patescibacteria group bacterium]
MDGQGIHKTPIGSARKDEVITETLNFIFGGEPHDERVFWDEVWRHRIKSGEFTELTNWFQKKLYEKRISEVLLPLYGDFHGKKVLEAGCGSGYAGLLLAKLGATTSFLDFSTSALEYSKELGRKISVPEKRVIYTRGDIRQLPFPSESFDLIYNSGVLEHYGDQEIIFILQEFKRVLKKGGGVFAVIPNLLSMEMLRRMKNFGKGSEHYISRKHFLALFKRAGLERVEIGSAHASALPSSLSLKIYERVAFLEKHLRRLDYLFYARGVKN